MSTGSSSSTRNYQSAWAKALEHLDHLPPEKHKYFNCLTSEERGMLRKNTSPDEILQLLQTTGASKRSKLLWVSDKLVKPFTQFQGIFEATAAACSGIGAPIWAPIKVILQLVVSVADEAGKIEGFLKDMLEKLQLFHEVEEHFQSSSNRSCRWDLLHNALTCFYVDVIDFTLVTAKHYRSHTIRHLARRLWNTFDSDFGDIISSMKRHLDSIPPAIQLEAIKETRQHYEDLSSVAKTGVDLAKMEASLNAARLFDEQRRAVYTWLSATGMDADLQKLQSYQLPSTCDWFFDNSTFHHWLDTTDSSSLCVLGIPGCGKSVLSTAVISRLRTQGVPVLHFFCKKGDENRNSSSSILRTLIFQLLDHPIQGPDFIGIVHDTLSKGIAARDYSIRDLGNLLKRIVDIIAVVYLVIDGLDECHNIGGDLADLLARLSALSISNPTGVKIFVTSRPNYFEITWPPISLEESDVEGDINIYINSRIETSPTLKLHEAKISPAIQKGAGGTFLWAKLMLDTLERSSVWEIEQVLNDLPHGLSDVYDLMLRSVSRLPTLSVKRCQKVLYWCVAACRLLTVDELLMALAVSENVLSQEMYDAGSDRAASLKRLQHDCGSLIAVRKDDCVQLVHTSLQEYLVRQRSASSPLITDIDLNQVHREFARICLRYNQFSCFEPYIESLELSQFERKYPFSRYSTTNWIFHVILSDSDNGLAGEIIAFFSSSYGSRWLRRCDEFGLSNGHIQLFQGQLKSWAELLEATEIGGHHFTLIGSFILPLRKEYYEEISRGNEEMNVGTAFAASYVGTAYYAQGRYDEALVWHRRALAGYEAALEKEHPSTLATVGNIASVYDEQGKYDEALVWHRRALAGCETALGLEHPSTLATVGNIAIVFTEQGKYDEALVWHRRALAGKEIALGKEHPSTLATVGNIANVFHMQGKYDEALVWYKRALAGKETALGLEHPSTLVTVGNIAIVFHTQGKHDEALVWHRCALTGKENSLGKQHPSTLDTVGNIAIVLTEEGKYDEALVWHRRALAGKENALGLQHPSTLVTVGSIAIVFHTQGKYDEALLWHRRALAGYETALGLEHPSTLATVGNIANVLHMQSNYDEALRWYRRALAGKETTLGLEQPSTLATVGGIASVFHTQGKYDEALVWYRRALAGKEAALGMEHPSIMATVGNIANVLHIQGKYDEALVWYQRALVAKETALGLEHPSTLATVGNIANVLHMQGKYDEALRWYRRALAGKETTLGLEQPSTLATVGSIASVFHDEGKYDEALLWYRRALAGYETALGKDHPSTLRTASNLEDTARTRDRAQNSVQSLI